MADGILAPPQMNTRDKHHTFPRYVFVCGLHRSGTSLVAKLLAGHPQIDAIDGTDAPEQEGAYLQGAIPHTAKHGAPGNFAQDPDQHHTEASRYNTYETALRLQHDWDRVFTGGKHWRIEKSPVNVLRSRLYQQLFPLAHFIFVVRHPVAVARATAKWSTKSEADLIAHWQHAHALMLADLPYLHAAMILRYEDLTENPTASLSAVSGFLNLPPVPLSNETITNRNADYLTGDDPALPDAARILGYARSGPPDSLGDLRCRHPLRVRADSVLRHLD